jgi:hypothetical protein
MTELDSLTSLTSDTVKLGTKFKVVYVVTGGTTGTITLSCKDLAYSVTPDKITVTKLKDEKSITLSGPAGDAKVVVTGQLVRRRQFTQKVK